MNVLFCHDGPMTKDEYNNYYGNAHNDEMFKRYYKIAPNLKVAIRVKNDYKKNIEEKLSMINEPIEFIECPNISSVKGQIFNKKKVREILVRAISEVEYVVVRLPSLLGFMAYDIALEKNKPCLVEVVACPWDVYMNYSLSGKFIAPLTYLSMKKRVLNSQYTVYVTNEFLQNRYPTHGKEINASNVLLNDFDGQILNKRIESILELHKDKKIIIGTVGAVDVKYKGQEYIIQALGKLKEKGYGNFEYQLVGRGDQSYLRKIAYKSRVDDQIVFKGSMPHEEVFNWLDGIDIYTQPSRTEGLPRGLIEAMSRALPAFGAKSGGIPELIESKYIFSNSKNNINEIAKIILSFEKNIMIEQAKNNFNESKKYSRKKIEDRRNNFFEEFKAQR